MPIEQAANCPPFVVKCSPRVSSDVGKSVIVRFILELLKGEPACVIRASLGNRKLIWSHSGWSNSKGFFFLILVTPPMSHEIKGPDSSWIAFKASPGMGQSRNWTGGTRGRDKGWQGGRQSGRQSGGRAGPHAQAEQLVKFTKNQG